MTQSTLNDAFETSLGDGRAVLVPTVVADALGPVDVVPAHSLGSGLAELWDDLSSRACEPDAFARRWFMEPSLAHYGGDRDELILAMQQGRAIGLFPLRKYHLYGKVPAPHLRTFSHPNMFLSPVTLAAGQEDLAWASLLQSLAGRGDRYALVGPFDRDGPVADSLRKVAEENGFAIRAVRAEVRAFYQSDLPPEDYWAHSVRGKKRKELRRQERRLGELGNLAFTRLAQASDLDTWCDDFLALEAAGWKGQEGSALGTTEATAAFFRDVLAGAWQAESLAMCRLTLDGRAVAMLATLIDGTGGFSFKTAYDESLSAYSPGVLLQYHNLDLPGRAGLDWIDSCAAPDHPMIDSLWQERRTTEYYAISLQGGLSRMLFDLLHRAKAWKRNWRSADKPLKAGKP